MHIYRKEALISQKLTKLTGNLKFNYTFYTQSQSHLAIVLLEVRHTVKHQDLCPNTLKKLNWKVELSVLLHSSPFHADLDILEHNSGNDIVK